MERRFCWDSSKVSFEIFCMFSGIFWPLQIWQWPIKKILCPWLKKKTYRFMTSSLLSLSLSWFSSLLLLLFYYYYYITILSSSSSLWLLLFSITTITITSIITFTILSSITKIRRFLTKRIIHQSPGIHALHYN